MLINALNFEISPDWTVPPTNYTYPADWLWDYGGRGREVATVQVYKDNPDVSVLHFAFFFTAKKSTLYTNVTPDLLDVELFELEDLVPAVSPNGIITYEGRSYSLYVPEGKRLLMMYDMDMRRKIASIQQPAVRADYERRFRLNMRGMIDRIYYEKETPHT